MAGLSAFREAFMSSDTQNDLIFSSFEARRLRYQVFWAFYENSAYRDIHAWSKLYRADYGLYKWIRNIYNPAYRIGEFWRSHLLAGPLDPNAGDGSQVPTALPIITDNEKLRLPISVLWKASNWSFLKDTLSLWGPTLGDAFLQVNDDPIRERVYLTLRHPGTIKSIEKDSWGNIKTYVVEEEWANPDATGKTQIYNEYAYRNGVNVIYETYLDGKPYYAGMNEDGSPSNIWSVPYGFIPMVAIQHNDVGLDFGWSEYHPALSKIREVDDITSKLDDQIRKMVDAPWLFAGIDKEKAETTQATEKDPNQPEAGRQKIPAIYGPVSASATPLVANLDISAASDHITELLKDIEKDYPELTIQLQQATGDISGRALRLHRQPVEDKVLMRRQNYDSAIVRAQQMAIAIGGWRQYEGYEGFDLESYSKGLLDHTIGDRPVFKKDPSDDLSAETDLYTAALAAKNAGIALPIFLKRMHWTDQQIAEITDSLEYQSRMAGLKAAMEFNQNPSFDPTARTITNGKSSKNQDPNQ